MSRAPRVDIADTPYHVINRANARLQIFFKEEDYKLFESILAEGVERYGMRLLAYCLMPNHFHLVLYPKKDGDVQKFMQWVTLTHTQRWHARHKTIGSGHLYQGRYKSFIVEQDKHLLSVIRYVERNPLRAKLVKRAETWLFSSAARHANSKSAAWLAQWPIPKPSDYLSFLNTPLTAQEQESIRYSVNHGKPYGSDAWSDTMIERFGLASTTRSRGRPGKGT
jgi:putative transposase